MTLRKDGHTVFHAFAGLSAIELAFSRRVPPSPLPTPGWTGFRGSSLSGCSARTCQDSRSYLDEHQPIHPAIEGQLPEDVPVPREPFTADDLRAHVAAILDGDRKQITR
jgi:hypothetical protein